MVIISLYGIPLYTANVTLHTYNNTAAKRGLPILVYYIVL